MLKVQVLPSFSNFTNVDAEPFKFDTPSLDDMVSGGIHSSRVGSKGDTPHVDLFCTLLLSATYPISKRVILSYKSKVCFFNLLEHHCF